MIKKHMDEAPILEAYEQNLACPLCGIESSCEKQYVSSALGASVMEPSERVTVNEKGFCERHLRLLYESGDRLPLALMLDTHLEKVIQSVKNARDGAGLFRGNKLETFHSCHICDKIEYTMSRYESTLIYMYSHSPEFRKKFLESKGVCMRHYERLMRIAPRDFARDLSETTLSNLVNIKRDVHWYTLKFDYRNDDKPWGNSLDSCFRAIGALRGNRNIKELKT